MKDFLLNAFQTVLKVDLLSIHSNSILLLRLFFNDLQFRKTLLPYSSSCLRRAASERINDFF